MSVYECLKIQCNFNFEILDIGKLPNISCDLVDKVNRTNMGDILFETSLTPLSVENKGKNAAVKRSLAPKIGHQFFSSKTSKTAPQTTNAQNNVTKALTDLDLMPSIESNNLQCTLCSYKATLKSNLKTHYKLKHLGGADLSMCCSLCQKRCTTKGNLKSHLINLHKLSKEDAIKLTS